MLTYRWLSNKVGLCLHAARKENGAIIVFVALALVIMIGIIGLAVDLGHAYVNKSQLQNIADACALAGASALDGSAAGITEAQLRATDSSGALANKFEFNSANLAITGSWVTYSAALDGTYVDAATAQGTASTIKFVKVTIPSTQQSAVFFGKIVPGVPSSLNLGAEAVAGRDKPNCIGSVDPFSPAARDLNDPNFGFVPGGIYSLRLSGGTSSVTGCNIFPGGPVEGNFGWADPCECGNNTPCIQSTILSGCAAGNCVGLDITVPSLDATPGNKGNAGLKAVRDRWDQDTDQTEYYSYAAYQTGYHGNNRRVIRVAVNNPALNTHSEYFVVGFGCFFMPVEPGVHPPSDEICMMYIGSCGINGEPTATPTASITRPVLFR
jgi:Flp pilus assembly protein TadG